jgi:transposase
MGAGWRVDFIMKKEERIVNKIRRLIRQAGLPRFLHRFGPKKFLLWQICLGLLVKEVFRLSYRRAMKFIDEFYAINLHWTTLQKFRIRVPLYIWKTLLKSTLGESIAVAAIDGTSMQRHNPSMHYLKRIDREDNISIPIYLNVMVDVIRRKFVAIKHHATKCGEIPDAYYLLKQFPNEIELAVMDKLYDSEKLHRFLRERGTYSIIPVKKNWCKGQLRKQLRDCFDYCLYWQRNLIESLFSALKRLFGNYLHSLSARTQRAEIFMRMIAYNLGAIISEIFY